jgi:response regulator RpfG family c-di-GMP phosphodiesterase
MVGGIHAMRHVSPDAPSQDAGQPVTRGPTLGVVLATRSKMRVTDVLIVDDDPQLREFFVTSLTLEGYQVAAAANGADALSYLRRRGPVGVILLDLSDASDGWLDVLPRTARGPSTQRT